MNMCVRGLTYFDVSYETGTSRLVLLLLTKRCDITTFYKRKTVFRQMYLVWVIIFFICRKSFHKQNICKSLL